VNYLTRQTVCDRLRLGLRQSYRVVGCSYGALVGSDEVVGLLNRARRACGPLSFVPSDLLTPEELSDRLVEDGVTAHDLVVWCRRTKNVPPHYRLNRSTIRFRESEFSEWMRERSRIRRRG